MLAFTLPEFPTPDSVEVDYWWVLKTVPATLDEVNPVTLTDVRFQCCGFGGLNFTYPNTTGGMPPGWRLFFGGPQIWQGTL